MIRPRPFRPTAAAAIALLAAPVLTPATAQQPAPARPVPGLSPALATGQVPAIAWTATDADGDRVRAAIPAEMPGRLQGPSLPGNDGAPTLATTREGFLLAASRTSGTGGAIWYQRWRDGRWSEAELVDGPRADNHHPVAAGSRQALWLVWVGGDGGRLQESLYAAHWTGSGWSAIEALPAAPGSPMAPAIALDHRGRPAVVWAALDGADSEIWYTRRVRGAWTNPTAVTDNGTHDILPHLAFVDGRPVIAWSTAAETGYVPVVASGSRSGARWRKARALSAAPGSSPKIFAARSGPGIVWSSPDDDGDGSRLRVATREPGGWTPETDLQRTPGPRFGVARGSARGELTVGWVGRERPTASTVREITGPEAGFDVRALAGDLPRAGRRFSYRAITFPGTYRGFGDSITEGTVRFDGVVEDTDGYPVPLADLISLLLGAPVGVENRGLGGEFTAEGLGRLRGLMTFPTEFTLVMEGANDIANLLDPVVSADNLHAMVRTVIDAGSIPTISTVTPRLDGFDERIAELNSQLLARVSSEPAIIVDQHSAFAGRGDLYSDTLHPNQDGYEVMAGVWFRALRPVLQQLLQDQDVVAARNRDALLKPTRRRPIR